MDELLNPDADESRIYAWGRLFAAPWEEIVTAMAERAKAAGFTQVDEQDRLNWLAGEPHRPGMQTA